MKEGKGYKLTVSLWLFELAVHGRCHFVSNRITGEVLTLDSLKSALLWLKVQRYQNGENNVKSRLGTL